MCIICTGEYKNKKGLKELYCHGCPQLTSIPIIEGLEILECYDCPQLTSISIIEGLKELDCSGCPQLTSIPVIEGLKELYCSDCPKLTSIPVIEGMKELYCTGCTQLTSIPVIEGLEILYCSDCTWIKLQNNNYDSNIQKLVLLQILFRKHLLIKNILKISKLIIPLWWDPQCKGGYFHKKQMFGMLETM